MTRPFELAYAAAYDRIYEDKDYDGETDLLEEIFQRYGPGPVKRVLDLGCGTGNHALSLAARGYEVVGVDNAPGMLGSARAKANAAGVAATFFEGDIRKLDLDGTFDAVVLLFAVLGYQCTNEDVQSTLEGARRRMADGGLLAFDVWYGPAVLVQRPRQRIRVLENQGVTLIKASQGQLDVSSQICLVDMDVWELQEGRLANEAHERHRMRYFFPQELALFLRLGGFELLRLGAFPDIDRDPDEDTWNVMGVAQAV
ncbi:MAG: class I SAM-dependent DNA methyltransferase [Actinomycetota bacterium]